MRLLLLTGIGILCAVAAVPNSDNARGSSFPSSASESAPAKRQFQDKYENNNARLSDVAGRMAGRSARAFASKLIKEIVKDAERNFVCSPIGVSTVLSMAFYGARRYTELVLRLALRLPSLRYLGNIGFQSLVDNFTTYEEAELRMANGIFVRSDVTLNPDFIETTTRTFRSEVQSLDFGRATEASDAINAWFDQKTNGRISSVVSPDDLSGGGASLVLANAMYFKGTWQTEFEPKLTRNRTFYADGSREIQVPSMEVTGAFNFGILEGVGAAYLELPYKSEDEAHRISMFVLLPIERDGLARLESNFEKITFAELYRNGASGTIRVVMPKFKIESEIDLKEPLKRLNLERLFEGADFTGIIRNPPLSVSKILQKAFIQVDEKGSEAAAATGAIVGARMLSPMTDEFIVDHPFIAIVATRTSNPVNLFTVRFTGDDDDDDNTES